MERQEPSRRDMGRAKFLERVWQWKAESGGTIVNQLKRLGASCDWSRERFTMDEGLSRAVVKVFVELHREGLIYKDKRLVNWDPKLQTAISDLEVEPREVKGRSAIGMFWDDICSRAMTHKVDTSIAEGSRLAFTQACTYPDGAKVFCLAVIELKGGKIAQQTVVQAWDE